MEAETKLNETYSCNTANNVTVDVSLGEGQTGRINLLINGELVDYSDDTLSHDFSTGSGLVGTSVVFDVKCSQPDIAKTSTNVQYVFKGGTPTPKIFKNSQTLTGGDATTSFTDKINFTD